MADGKDGNDPLKKLAKARNVTTSKDVASRMSAAAEHATMRARNGSGSHEDAAAAHENAAKHWRGTNQPDKEAMAAEHGRAARAHKISHHADGLINAKTPQDIELHTKGLNEAAKISPQEEAADLSGGWSGHASAQSAHEKAAAAHKDAASKATGKEADAHLAKAAEHEAKAKEHDEAIGKKFEKGFADFNQSLVDGQEAVEAHAAAEKASGAVDKSGHEAAAKAWDASAKAHHKAGDHGAAADHEKQAEHHRQAAVKEMPGGIGKPAHSDPLARLAAAKKAVLSPKKQQGPSQTGARGGRFVTLPSGRKFYLPR